jgi:hypothetical protein
MLSRTSISQTFENVQFMLEPVSGDMDMSRFPNQKPFLLVAAHCDKLTAFEKMLIHRAEIIDSTGNFSLYDLPFNTFKEIADSIDNAVMQEFQTIKLFEHHGTGSSDSLKTFVMQNYDSLTSKTTYFGSGSFSSMGKKSGILYSGGIPNADTSLVYNCSFWLNDVKADLYARTKVRLVERDKDGNEVYKNTWQAFRIIEKIDDSWALASLNFKLRSPENTITITIENKQLRNKPIYIDNFMINRESTTLFQISDSQVIRNNRFSISGEIAESYETAP